MRRHTPAMLGLGRWGQRDLQTKANLNYIVRPVLKQMNKCYALNLKKKSG